MGIRKQLLYVGYFPTNYAITPRSPLSQDQSLDLRCGLIYRPVHQSISPFPVQVGALHYRSRFSTRPATSHDRRSRKNG